MIISYYKGKEQYSYLFLLIIILLEYANSLFRYLGVIEMSCGIFWRKVNFIFLLFCALYIFLKHYVHNRPIQVSRCNIMCITILGYILIGYIITTNKIDISAFANIILPFLMIFLGKRTKLKSNSKIFSVICVSYVLFVAFMYFTYVRNGTVYRYKTAGLNSVYYLVVFFPILALIENKIIQSLLILIIILTAVISLKSTALLAIITCMVIWYFYKSNKKRYDILKLVVFPVIALMFLFILINILKKNRSMDFFDIFVKQNINDGGNGRISIWLHVMKTIFSQNIFNLIFGKGYHSVELLIGMMAHNDFIEAFYDYGLIGLIIFTIFYFSLWYKTLNMIRDDYKYAKSFLMFMIVFTVFCCFSDIIFGGSYDLLLFFNIFALINDYEKWRNCDESINNGSCRFANSRL